MNTIVITNNPLVAQKLEDAECTVLYQTISYEEVLRTARDKVHEGYALLTHPLSGSVKPNETPYKSVMVSRGKGEVDMQSLRLIENALDACKKFQFRSDKYRADVYPDFQLIDWTLLQSALESADFA